MVRRSPRRHFGFVHPIHMTSLKTSGRWRKLRKHEREVREVREALRTEGRSEERSARIYSAHFLRSLQGPAWTCVTRSIAKPHVNATDVRGPRSGAADSRVRGATLRRWCAAQRTSVSIFTLDITRPYAPGHQLRCRPGGASRSWRSHPEG